MLTDPCPLLLRGLPIHIWVWLKIKQQGLRKFWSMFPLTRVPFWYRFFEPQPYLRWLRPFHRLNRPFETVGGLGTCKGPWKGRKTLEPRFGPKFYGLRRAQGFGFVSVPQKGPREMGVSYNQFEKDSPKSLTLCQSHRQCCFPKSTWKHWIPPPASCETWIVTPRPNLRQTPGERLDLPGNSRFGHRRRCSC